MARKHILLRFGDIKPPQVLAITRSVHVIFWLLITSFLCALVIAFVFHVEIVAQGTAKLVYAGRSKEVQSEFTLPIKDILVHNGDQVTANQPLVRLEDTDVLVALERAKSTLAQLAARKEVLDFLIKATNHLIREVPLMDQSQGLGQMLAPAPDLVDRETLGPELEVLEKIYLNGMREIEKHQADIARIKRNRDIYDTIITSKKEVFDAASELLAKGSINRGQYLLAKDDLESARLEVQHTANAMEEAQDGIALVKSRLELQLAEKRSLYSREFADIEQDVSELDLQIVSLGRQVDAATVVAPVAGTVEYLSVFTNGELARAGQTLMQIVPEGDSLVLEATIPNSDIGLLSEGQKVNINYEAYPAPRFGIQHGRVASISTDAQENEVGEWNFLVMVALDDQALSHNQTRFELSSGMTAQIEVVTGSRKLISYFVAPIVAVLQGSLGEY